MAPLAVELIARVLRPPSGQSSSMDENAPDRPDGDITSPPDPTHDATTPPGNPPADERAVRESEEKLDQAGGGH